MPVVNGIARGPGGVIPGARVVAALIADPDGPAPGFVPANDQEVLGVSTAIASSVGAWSFTLEANANITPSNTYYRITEYPHSGSPVTYTISVPDSAGPHWVGDILLAEPGDLPEPNLLESHRLSTADPHSAAGYATDADVTAHLTDAVDAHDASAVSYTPTGSVAATDVQAAIAEVAVEAVHPNLATHDALGLATDAELTAHESDSTAVHGITDTSVLETTTGAAAKVTAHEVDATAVHGIANTANLETAAGAQAKVDAAIAALLDSAPGALDTLNELAAALGDDPAFATTITNALATKLTQAQADALYSVLAHTHTHAATTGKTANDHHNEAHALNAAVHTGTLDDAQIPATIARDSEVTTAVTNHEAAANPHAVYETSAEAQAKVDVHTADASDAHDASAISFVPTGTVAATDVQAAIAEVAAETAGGAPNTADYLVGTAHGGLTSEIAVGTTPGGELGGSWASPTVDALHSGSTHTDFIAKALVDAKGDLIAATAADTPARLAVGGNGTRLEADSTQTAGVKWAEKHFSRAFTMDPRYCTANGSVVGTGGRTIYVRVTGGPVNASKLAITVGVSNGNISVAHFSNTGAGRAARPDTRLATSGAIACPAAGYQEIALGAASLVQEGDWLAISADGIIATFARVLGTGLQGNHGLSHWEAVHPAPATAAAADHTANSPSMYIEAIV